MAIDKTTTVQALIGDMPEVTTALITVYLADAEETILNRIYPFKRPSGATLPTQYDLLHCKLAARYILRRGAEGEIAHTENGIGRTYGSVNDDDLLSEVMQVATI